MPETAVHISKEHAEQLRKQEARYQKATEKFRDRYGWKAVPAAATERLIKKGITGPTNEQRAWLEIYDFMHKKPERYFAYVSPSGPLPCRSGYGRNYMKPKHIVTWTGHVIGDVTKTGRLYEDNFGGSRWPIRVKAINGLEYSGTYYASAGDYCRLKTMKPKGGKKP